MTLKYLKIGSLFSAILFITLLTSCKKDDADLKRQLAELNQRVSNIEDQLKEINKDLVILQQQGKLNSDEVNSLKVLTANLSTVTGDLKNNVNLNSSQIDALKLAIEKTVSTVQFDELRRTLSILKDLVNSNYLEQTAAEQKSINLDELVKQIAADLDRLKSTNQIATLDRPINVTASKGNFGTKIVVSWTPIPMATNYQIFKFDATLGQYTMVSQGPDTAFTDQSSFEAYKKVFYKVKVVNSTTAFSNFSDIDYGYTSGKNFSNFLSFGYEGTANGLFSFAMHVAVDGSNNIYVSDEGNNRVQKFDRLGNFKEVFYVGSGARAIAFLKDGRAVVTRTQSSSYIQILNSQKQVVREWGTYGNSNTQFGNIEEITVDDQDNIYVVDGINNAIKKFDSDGNFLLKFDAATRVSGQPDGPYPYGICLFNNKLFVTSPRNGLVRIFDKQGSFIKSWDLGSTAYAIKAFGNHLYICCEGYIMKTDENGETREKIGQGDIKSQIVGLAVNSDEEIIVSDLYVRSIRVFKKL